MRASAKLSAYGAVIAVVFAGALGVGAIAGPIDVGGDGGHGDEHEVTGERDEATDESGAEAVAADGEYRLDVGARLLPAEGGAFRFRVLDPEGERVTAFDVVHEKRMHLIVVSHDLTEYAHLHPTMSEDGEWRVEFPAFPSRSYQVYADFRPAGGTGQVLDVPVSVSGRPDRAALPAPARTANVHGYDVTLDGELVAGETEIGFTIERDGETIVPDPYLGADGHLVAIRESDLEYLHVHPLDDGSSDGPVRFSAELPGGGTYRLFLDFSHGGDVHTAAFTVEIAGSSGVPSTVDASLPTDDHDDGHEGH